jgi:hypothetical protein
MPEGSSSAAPVVIPGPKSDKNFLNLFRFTGIFFLVAIFTD